MSLNGSLMSFDQLARDYQHAYSVLADRVSTLEQELQAAKRARLHGIKTAVAKVKDTEAALRSAIEDDPQCFDRPKTQTLHGVKFGYRKGTATVELDDETKVIGRIKRLLAEKVESLIKFSEKADKKALQKLSKVELQKLGVTVVDPGDEVFIKNTASEVEKFVEGLLKEIQD